MRCERCGNEKGERYGSVALCAACLVLIVLEWKTRRDEFAELSAS
jgi:hypothetical protein